MANRAGVAKPGAAKTKSSFFGGIAAELKKVVWLSKRETAYLTLVVIIVAVIAGLALGGVDLGFAKVAERFFLGG